MGTKAMTEIGQRLKAAREAYGLALKDAALTLGFNNYQTLSAIEKGERNITAHELISMARLYGRDLDYFLDTKTTPDPVPLWRKQDDADITQANTQFRLFLEHYSTLEKALGLERRWKALQTNYAKSDFAHHGFELADRIAMDIHKRLDLGSRPATNLLSILENNLRYKILHWEIEPGVSGACVVDEDLGVGILINANDAPWRRNFDLAHELFHIVTWSIFSAEEIGTGQKNTKPEQYANRFASTLLLPEAHLREALRDISTDKGVMPADLVELAKDFDVSTDALIWRLVNLRIFTKTQAEKILVESTFKGIDRALRREEKKTEKPFKYPTRFISLACRCLLDGKISRGIFAQYLDIERFRIDQFLTESGYIEQGYEKVTAA